MATKIDLTQRLDEVEVEALDEHNLIKLSALAEILSDTTFHNVKIVKRVIAKRNNSLQLTFGRISRKAMYLTLFKDEKENS